MKLRVPTLPPAWHRLAWPIAGLAVLGAAAGLALLAGPLAGLLGLALGLGPLAVARGLWHGQTRLRAQLEQARQEQRELRRAHRQLAEAMAVMPEALALFDADDRLVIASHRYREMNPYSASVTVPGIGFEAIVRAAASAGEVLEAVGREDEWVRQRLEQHRAPRQDFLQALAHDRWAQVTERRTPEGGMVSLRTDVTELVRQRNALNSARQDAQEARRLLEGALDALPGPLEVFDAQDRLMVYNAALQKMFPHIDYPQALGKTFAELAMSSLRQGQVPEAVGREDEWLAQRQAERQATGPRQFLQAMAGPRWVQVFERRTPENYLVAVRIDVTEQVLQRQALQAAELEAQHARALLQDTIEALPVGVAMYDEQDRLRLCNSHYRATYPGMADALEPGRPFEELLDLALERQQYPDTDGPTSDWKLLRLAAHREPGPPILMQVSGPRWVRVHECRTSGGLTVGAHVDVTELVLKEQQLAQANRRLAGLSTTDALTSVHNRRSLDETLEREWLRCARHQQPLALLMIDIDHFKLYNDHYGHIAGDECLRRVARLLETEVRRAGEIVARYGGEEFVLLLPGVDETNALEVAQRCLEGVRQAHLVHGVSPNGGYLTLSIGVAAQRPDPERPSHTLLRAADEALYRAKTGGRNRVVVAEANRPGLRAV